MRYLQAIDQSGFRAAVANLLVALLTENVIDIQDIVAVVVIVSIVSCRFAGLGEDPPRVV